MNDQTLLPERTGIGQCRSLALRVFLLAGLLCSSSPLRAEGERFPVLRVGAQFYTNVTVTSVTATDIYFSHSRGLGNAKLKELEPELRKKFRFDPAKAAQKADEQVKNNALYTKAVREAPPPKPRPAPAPNSADAEEQVPADERPAKSFLNRTAPTIVAEKWLTEQPDVRGKFVLIDFWATWCAPCRRSIPGLNALHARFKDRLVIIGISSETEAAVRKMTEPRIEYAIAIDSQSRAARTIGVSSIPHALLMDPKGIVRFEGHPGYLNEKNLEQLMAKYSE